MSKYTALPARDNIWWVGALDPDLRVFDIVMWTDYGTTYNAYIVKGTKKTVLIETSKFKLFDEHLQRIESVCPAASIDYIVVNHTEPDHTGALEKLLELAPNATVLGSATALSFLKKIVGKPFKQQAVGENDEFDIGGMTLKFIPAQMLHWPDTMFTYIPEAKALFTCDSFGCHYSSEKVFNDLIEGDFYDAYKYYFDNIMGPYKNPHMIKALEKIEGLDIEFIGNGHGPVLRTNIQKYIDMYRAWSLPETPKAPKVVIAYASAYGYTEQLAQKITEGIRAAGIPGVELYDLVHGDKAAAHSAILSSTGFLLGSPTLVGDALPPVYEMLIGLNPIVDKNKYAGAFGSYAWSGEGVPNLLVRMKQLKMNLPLEGLRVKLKPNEEELAQAVAFGGEFAKAILSGENFAPVYSSSAALPTESSKPKKLWKCAVCGQLFEGEEPPAVCPVCGASADQFVQVDEETVSFSSNKNEAFVIVGGGIAALEAVRSIRLRNKAASVTMISDEDVLPYNRPGLSDAISGIASFDSLFVEQYGWYVNNNVTLLLGESAESIDKVEKLVRTTSGNTLKYDKLLIAAGSSPFVPIKDAMEHDNVFVLRKLSDAHAILEKAQASSSALIVGGGILGLEAADALKMRGLSIVIAEHGSGLMNAQLDATASALLREKLEAQGVVIHSGVSVTDISGNKVTLSSGAEVEADLIILSAGVRPNTALAAVAGADIGRAIKVNSMMETSVKDIYAAGDCAQVGDTSIALWPSSMAQGKVAGANMTGDYAILEKLTPAAVFDGFGAQLFSAGSMREDAGTTAMLYRDDSRGVYKKIVLRNGRVVGGLLMGDTAGSMKLLRAVENKEPLTSVTSLLG
jgi:flavorubredoxin/NADPH-dependent 2,4-dienoyl-CoA reductase/sulfur reductase-like enzyme/rubredoxin